MIELKNVSKTFKVNKKEAGLKGAFKALFKREKENIDAVKGISFKVNEGEIIGYIGSNGAGKSTTIKMMTGVLTPSSGEIVVNGLVPHKNRTENARHVGVVFGQRTQLWWDLPLRETFTILKEIYQVDDQMFKERFDYLAELLDIHSFIKQPVRTLSLGQRMRADLMASMLHNPKVLYLDEPTIGLDVLVKEKIRKAIKEINRKYKVTVILTTHDMTDIQELASRIMIIEKGEIIYDGSKEEINKKFGNNRTLKIKTDQFDEVFIDDLRKEIKSSDKQGYVGVEGNEISITFDQDKLLVAELLQYVMNKIKVLDFTLVEQDIEEIVKRLYQGGMNEKAV